MPGRRPPQWPERGGHEGIEAASGEWACVIDADLQHPPETIRRLLTQAERTDADIVVASRQADLLGPQGLSRARAFTSQSLTILARMLFPRVLKNVSDPLTGFFLFRREAVDTSILRPAGFKILLEILVRHPDLHVTEIHFDFAQRQAGESKADLNEGLRFFRHVTRLRLTVNQHLIRFLLLLLLAIVLNLGVLVELVGASDWSLAYAAAVAGGLTLVFVMVGEAWVFSDRPRGPARRRLALVLVAGAGILLLIYLPVTLLLARIGLPYWLAAFVAILATGFVYYLLSEQWIWTRGLTMRRRDSYTYAIHDILCVSSQVRLDDLRAFEVAEEPARVDLLVRVDRHGTPSRVPGAICYDEGLGRFGFGLTVLPGDFTEIVASPLLETSPAFLFTNVVEPVLRWILVGRGFALVPLAGAVPPGDEQPPAAILLAARMDMSYGTSRLCADYGMAFLGDDRIILGRDRTARSYPKPVTAYRDLVRQEPRTEAVAFRRLLYSRPVRRVGLWLGAALPAATFNTYLQRFIPQPKFPIQELVPGIQLAGTAAPQTVFLMEKGDGSAANRPPAAEEVVAMFSGARERQATFQPQPLLLEQLGRWNGRDWWAAEREVVRAALAGAELLRWQTAGDHWWEQFGPLAGDAPAALLAA